MRVTNPLSNPEQAFVDRCRYKKILRDERYAYDGDQYRWVMFDDWTFTLKNGDCLECHQTDDTLSAIVQHL